MRIALVALLVAWCFQIVRPLIVPVVWGIIIAVAVHPGYCRLESLFGGRRAIAATLCTVLMLAVLIVPTVMLAGTAADSAQTLAKDLSDGTIEIPAPPDDVASWPIIGAPLDRFWRLASENLEEAWTRSNRRSRRLGGGCYRRRLALAWRDRQHPETDPARAGGAECR